MARKKNIPDKAGSDHGNGAASRKDNENSITQERKQVVQDYLDAVREFATSIRRKMN